MFDRLIKALVFRKHEHTHTHTTTFYTYSQRFGHSLKPICKLQVKNLRLRKSQNLRVFSGRQAEPSWPTLIAILPTCFFFFLLHSSSPNGTPISELISVTLTSPKSFHFLPPSHATP